jgi:hypothetical protein
MTNYKLSKNVCLVKNHSVVQLIMISQTFFTVIIYDDDDYDYDDYDYDDDYVLPLCCILRNTHQTNFCVRGYQHTV